MVPARKFRSWTFDNWIPHIVILICHVVLPTWPQFQALYCRYKFFYSFFIVLVICFYKLFIKLMYNSFSFRRSRGWRWACDPAVRLCWSAFNAGAISVTGWTGQIRQDSEDIPKLIKFIFLYFPINVWSHSLFVYDFILMYMFYLNLFHFICFCCLIFL